MKNLIELLSNCRLCARNCGVNRLKGELGYCRAGANAKIARVALHNWEEPCISGEKGSGTIFFSNCTLGCVFCQNHQISKENVGKEVSIERLSQIFLEQQERGALNINLVTPTHYAPQIVEALKLAKANGLKLPILYNTNSYVNVETLRLLKGHVDVYLPDLKYFDDKFSIKYSNAPKYFEQASKAINEMFTQVGTPVFDENGIISRGVIIRHLMLPGLLFDSKKIIDHISSVYGDSVHVSLMNQYTPLFKAHEYKEIDKPLNPAHYESLIDYALKAGLTNGFIQEGETCSESFVPEFDLTGV